MSPDNPEVLRFLRRAMIVRVATLSRKGQPHLTPLWFVQDRGNICMTARQDSPAARDIATNPSVVLLFDAPGETDQKRVLRILGKAEFRRDMLRRVALQSALKYHLSPGGMRDLLSSAGQVRAKFRYYRERAGEGGVIAVTPVTAEFLPKPA